MIDTSVFVRLERLRIPLAGITSLVHPREPIAVSAMTASELLFGSHRAQSGRRNIARVAGIEALVSTVPVLDFDLLAARVHASVWAELARTGNMIGTHDLVIGATALAYGYDVLTENISEFGRIPGLNAREPDYSVL